MRTLCRHAAARGVIATALLTFATAPLVSQVRVMIGARPAPNQTVRLRLLQDMDFTLKPVGGNAPAGFPPGGMTVTGSSSLLLRQDVGAVDENGRLRLDVTYEEVGQQMRLNDEVVPIPQEAIEALRGKTVTIWMGPKREILEVLAPPNFPLPPDQMQQLLGPLQASVPSQEMSVGELVTLPFSMALPLPVPGTNAPPMMVGQTKTTLTKLTPEGGDQLALLDQSIEVGVDGTTNPRSGPNVSITVKLSGTGTTEMFVTSGLLKSTRMEATMSGQFEPAGSGSASLKLAGTLKMDVTRVP